MLIEPYQLEELNFAWCYRVSYSWRTYRNRPQPPLAALDQPTLNALLEPYDIHILEAGASSTEVRLLASLLPGETVAVAASKAKGRVSKWLREQLNLAEPEKLLSRSYFGCTSGKSTAEDVAGYLDQQSEHHGYASRPCPPVFVQSYPITAQDEQRLSPRHAVAALQLHMVLATQRRKGVFGRTAGEATAECWRQLQDELCIALEKVSFVPDHVHLAVRIHPSVSPAKTALALMNAAQELMWKQFDESVIRAGIERLWQPSAYIGAYGELRSASIASAIRRWSEQADD